MRFFRGMLITIILSAVCCFASTSHAATVEVDAPVGRVLGSVGVEGTVERFLGLRYGSAERFGIATAFKYPAGKTINATAFGAWCFQASYPLKPDPANTYSEDCLFLNIWRKAAPARSPGGALAPVLFYIHGGAFTQGSGADPLFDGAKLAAATGSVVVTINYRLGPLGFLVLDSSGRGGMNGLADAALALSWIQRNAAAFGGDPARVTVFGESAGGCATCTLAVSGAARGMMRRAIVESGPCVGPWGPETRAQGISQRDALFLRHGVASIQGLMSVGAQNLSWPLPTGGFFLDDGHVMGVQPIDRFRTPGALHVDTLAIGSNSFDGTSELLPYFPKPNASPLAYQAALALRFGPARSAAVAQQYPPSRYAGSASAAFVEADSDATNACPNLQIARAVANTSKAGRGSTPSRGARDARGAHGPRIFLYQFAHLQPQCDLGNYVHAVPANYTQWASHGAEIVFLWGNKKFRGPLDGKTIQCEFSAGERGLSASMISLWNSLASTGVPQDHTAAGVRWPAFRDDDRPDAAAPEEDEDAPDAEHTLRFSVPHSGPVDGLKRGDCAYWNAAGMGGGGSPTGHRPLVDEGMKGAACAGRGDGVGGGGDHPQMTRGVLPWHCLDTTASSRRH